MRGEAPGKAAETSYSLKTPPSLKTEPQERPAESALAWSQGDRNVRGGWGGGGAHLGGVAGRADAALPHVWLTPVNQRRVLGQPLGIGAVDLAGVVEHQGVLATALDGAIGSRQPQR